MLFFPLLWNRVPSVCAASVLIEGVKYYANNPKMIGKTFLRLERDFDKHVRYCRDAPLAQEFLAANDAVRDFFMVSTLSWCGYYS